MDNLWTLETAFWKDVLMSVSGIVSVSLYGSDDFPFQRLLSTSFVLYYGQPNCT